MKPTLICLTSVRNEAWIFDIYLQVASLWPIKKKTILNTEIKYFGMNILKNIFSVNKYKIRPKNNIFVNANVILILTQM